MDPAGFPNVACGPPTAGTNGLNTGIYRSSRALVTSLIMTTNFFTLQS